MLLDDREQVGEQLALEQREVVRDLGADRVRVVRAVDRPVPGDGDGTALGLAGAARDRRAQLVALRGQAACWIVSLVRYRSPSSSLRW
jgi:hypothetical protein